MFHGERAPLPTCGGGLLRGNRTRSYGSLVQSNLSPVRQRRIEHQVQPGETLQGLALKYGVSMEQIKRANRLYTNDSIFLKKSLSIPVLSDDYSDVNNGDGWYDQPVQASSCEKMPRGRETIDVFGSSLYQQDNRPSIYEVKQCHGHLLSQNASASHTWGSAPHHHQCTKKLREREDEIFEL
ncbi:hypothetical protein J4Q44_G00019640 [Coregonus suidteri]|uniref:LysM and putative peptidoglycan-binding domain-containing protein 1 n=1 Tax=Coregonus suidteri TaxID=861788 RepID=A0AAN8MB23_9TELE